MLQASVDLLPFQQAGAWFLAGRRRALNADAPRVGKTPQAIRACDLLGLDTVLVLCPAIARLNWLREFQRFSDRNGSAILRHDDPAHPTLTVCSYDQLIDQRVYRRIARNYDAVILDEAHYCKSMSSKRTQAAFAIANGAHYAWALTGTPAPNHAAELWPLLSRFGVTPLDYWAFVKRYCVFYDSAHGIKVTGNRDVEGLRMLIRDFTIRRTLPQVAPEMPPARWSVVSVEPGRIMPSHESPAFTRLACEEETRLLRALDAAHDDVQALPPDVAMEYRRFAGLSKVEPVGAIIGAELDEGHLERVVVFAWHTDVLHALRVELAEYSPRVIDGATSSARREEAIASFQAGSCSVLLCQILAAGTAIDLSVCDDIVFVEEDWVPANNQQASQRCMSQFKSRPVRIRSVVIDGSADERVQAANARKTRIANQIFC